MEMDDAPGEMAARLFCGKKKRRTLEEQLNLWWIYFEEVWDDCTGLSPLPARSGLGFSD
jgi:hypothetical protein